MINRTFKNDLSHYTKAFHQVILYVKGFWSNLQTKKLGPTIDPDDPMMLLNCWKLVRCIFLDVLCCGWPHNSSGARRYNIFTNFGREVLENHAQTSLLQNRIWVVETWFSRTSRPKMLYLGVRTPEELWGQPQHKTFRKYIIISDNFPTV